MEGLSAVVPFVLIALLFWLLIIRPAQKRQKAVTQMQSSLTVGAEVMLTSGIFGTVREMADDHLRVEVADGIVLRVVRGAIGSIVTSPDAVEHDVRPEHDELPPRDDVRPVDPDTPSSPSTHEER